MYHALIQTHHVTSKRKVAALRDAARTLQCAVVIRRGGTPGLMYVRGASEEGVRAWVDAVRRLRYKDFHVLRAVETTSADAAAPAPDKRGVAGETHEVDDVAAFGREMEERGLRGWWRAAMGYARDERRVG